MFTLPPLSYSYDALEPYIDAETMKVHHDGHHAAYVKNLNDALADHPEFLKMDVDELIKSLDKIPEEIRTKVRNNGGGHANHSLFWTILSPDGGSNPKGQTAELIDKTFSSFGNFKKEFSQMAATIFGSGWAWLVVDNGNLAIISTPNQNSPLSEGKTPILALDVWEHAYYLKYQNRRAEYIEAWWNVVNWGEVERRLLSALS